VVGVTLQLRFTSRERSPGTNWIGGWVGLRAGLDTKARGKILCQGSNPYTILSILTELLQLLEDNIKMDF
jgi:hypothetical protein